jgi:signal recognition particle receptor subunit beta
MHFILNAFTNLPSKKECPPIAILAHKVDLVTSSAYNTPTGEIAISRVKSVLERELAKRSMLQKQSVGIDKMGEENLDVAIDGLEFRGTGMFKFSDWAHGEVTFLSSSVRIERDDFAASEKPQDSEKASVSPTEDGLKQLKDWVLELDM